ncbi:hypothetical protein AGDE_14716 [Angomonas deanei]|uniref:Uncharacterized protein n=1 Tax=Angomonas deanei TaxID=59799 RepID=A0A7G2C2V7_9TRYP|nr:hypothetical protein AGDE_14716 [Angomonas deanei]CAD2213027.1 hypothetical protein, conserved [Angomonas deanei]|eukprot:EPY20363.1 hypothetical protein AGDE_14716 [Angomonas deanei]
MAEGGVAEDPEYFVSDVGVSPLLGKITRPCQPGWSDHMMEDSTPYHIMTSNSLQTNIKYELNDIDYLWCAENNLDTFSLQRGFTYLEWCYVSSLLKAVESGGALTQLKKKVGPHKGQSDPSDAVEGGTRSARFLNHAPCAHKTCDSANHLPAPRPHSHRRHSCCTGRMRRPTTA